MGKARDTDPMLRELLKGLSEAAEELSNVLGEEFVGMALFGSHARSEARPDSDVDVLVVLRSIKGVEVRSKIYNIVSRHVRRAVTLVDLRLSDVSGKVLELTPLLLNVLNDAVIVYDREGVLKLLIDKCKELIRKGNLVRYRTPNGKYGWKRADNRPLGTVEV